MAISQLEAEVKILVLLAAVFIAPTPAPPSLDGCAYTPGVIKVIETAPVVYADPENNVAETGRVLLANGTAEYSFIEVGECIEQFPPLPPEDPSVFAPQPPTDPYEQVAPEP